MKKTLVTLLTLAFTAGNACSAFAAGPAGIARGLTRNSAVSYISEKGTIIPPFAQVLFCAQNPTECRDNNGPAVVALTDAQMLQLKNVNTSVNRTMMGRNDPGNELNGDVWKVNVRSGDCEDFALTKRSRLIAMGWSSRALRIATAYTPSGEGHAVLVVRTDKGDLVLDNRKSSIKNWRDTDLRWDKIQSGTDPYVWYRL
ncbi:transglutaminase-like cysteine peptidase [Rhizobium leguminosarum]|jgi:predicted transglutaminase-like cysteine proteinase|uniref:transglutaminase-like cysteine peptidase n=1 Tax=Rhizobium leguminosarum TaxID=384 RepID=UPI001C96FA27|nr:transglutaminase-like cysteine peptidase [Rhizobium leguminosarum]MBY5334408.1 transglutaminase-like cysteine peptidase [Rhizobium leguminosarum]MBY5345965.1 transglutaminase-like cysteine peptidase [Rhizobium leguminosarum]MBY5411354.1 transglutaminase-like cysteine peptidase [Rhizobium leguminosarum]